MVLWRGGCKMMTLKQYRKIVDEHSDLKRKNQIVPFLRPPISPGIRENPEVRSYQGFESAREIVARDMKKAIILLKKKNEIKQQLESLGPRHGYVDVLAACSGCGELFTETYNIYEDYDFGKALCPDCKAREENLEQVKVIEEGKNLKPQYNDVGELVEVTFESGGKTFSLKYEDDGDCRPLTVEKE